MEPNKGLGDLEAEVRRLEEALHAERSMGRQTNRTVIWITVALGVTIFGFLLANYMTLSSLWTREKFRQSLEREMTELSPAAVRELNTLGRELLPVYAEEGRKQLMEMGPELARRFEEQLDQLTEELLQSVHQQLKRTEENVLVRTEEIVFKSFPSLHDAEKRELLERRFHWLAEQAVAEAIASFENLVSKDVDNVKETLLKFDVSDGDESTVDLQKKFIHLWLKLLDQEIMEL